MTYQLHHGNCLDIMPLIERESVDAVICDGPYGISFMGRDWDHGVPGMHFWFEALRCAKPGAYLLAFGGTRTFHRLAVAIEDAGWEIRDTVMWVYGQGFPKSHDVSKAIDREAGAEREVIGRYQPPNGSTWNLSRDKVGGNLGAPAGLRSEHMDITSPATPAAAKWDGWGTALKPAWEPIIVARKPLVGTVAENVQRYGTGAMNIDACRIETDARPLILSNRRNGNNTYGDGLEGSYNAGDTSQGRWPANLIHDGSAEVLAGFPMTTQASWRKPQPDHAYPDAIFPQAHKARERDERGHNDTGSAARFFYCAKASKHDRDEGCEGLEGDSVRTNIKLGVRKCNVCGSRRNDKIPYPSCGHNDWKWVEVSEGGSRGGFTRNGHPTVKPTALMRYLCRLVTPPNGTILDPFMGSGSTGKAAMLEGFNFIGIDTEIEYVKIAARRIEHACEKVGIVVDQPMMFETKRETVDRPKQLILL